MDRNLTRRSFLKRATAGGVGFALPSIVPSSVFGAAAPSNQTTIGAIGVGGRGSGVTKQARLSAETMVILWHKQRIQPLR